MKLSDKERKHLEDIVKANKWFTFEEAEKKYEYIGILFTVKMTTIFLHKDDNYKKLLDQI